MSGYDGRGTKFPLTIVRGADMAFSLTVTDDAGAAVNVSAATIAGEVYTTAGVLVDTLTAVVSGAGNNVVTLSFTDTETAALTSDSYQWTLWVTRGADKRPWLAGPVRLTAGTNGGRSTSGTTTLTVDGNLSVAVTVAGATSLSASAVTLADTAGNYASSTVEGALAELPAQYGSAERFAQYDIRDYGAAVDGVVITDAVMTSGSPVLSSTSYEFTSTDIGKIVGVLGAGTVSGDYVTNANDGVLVSSVLSVSGGDATLTNNAVNTVSGATAVFGTADDAAVLAAHDAASAAGGGTVYFPPGRTVVAGTTIVVDNFVSWAGAHRDVSWVEIIKSAGSGLTGEIDWLSCSGRDADNPLTGADFHDFGVEARCMIRPSGFNTALKPLNIYHIKRCSIYRTNVWNTPATAIPFDKCQDQCNVIFNVVLNPGRLFPGTSTHSGGSGIGVGTTSAGDELVHPMVVGWNTIIGNTTTPIGHNGIFTEAQTGGSAATPSRGFRIVGNYVAGMRYGIADKGSGDTIIESNHITSCVFGIDLATTILGGSFAGVRTLIANNSITNCIDPDTEGLGHGIRVQSNYTSPAGPHALITGNYIRNCVGRGIQLTATTGSTQRLATVTNNVIRETGRSGVYVSIGGSATSTLVVIKDNIFTTHGTLAVSGDTGAVTIAGTLSGVSSIDSNICTTTDTLEILSGVTVGASCSISYNRWGGVNNAGSVNASARVIQNRNWTASVPTVTGSRGGNAALASLLTQLAALGLVVDSSS